MVSCPCLIQVRWSVFLCKVARLFLGTLVIGLAGCAFFREKQWEYRIVDRYQKVQVVLAYDSSEVRKLLADEDTREYEINHFWREKHTDEQAAHRFEDMRKNPELYPPGRLQFLAAMANMPGFAVPVKSYCSIIQRSKSTCGDFPDETVVYVLIKVTSGP